MSHLLLSVPETVTSHYVIATNDPPPDPYAVVPWRVPEPFRRPAIEALRTPRLGIVVIDARAATWRFDDVLASEEDHRRIRGSSHHIVVAHEAATAEQPRREQTARAVARALADATGGVLIDPQARQVVLRDGLARVERDRFRMADQWLGTRYDVGAAGATAGVPATDCSCLRITLVGLRRFGLPDLVIDKVACAHDVAALNLLRALACRLLGDQWRWAASRPDQRVRSLADHPKVEPDDFWAFWSATPFTDGRPLVVRLAAPSPAIIEVGPPAGYDGTRAQWGREVLARAMPPLVGCPADDDLSGPRSAGGGL